MNTHRYAYFVIAFAVSGLANAQTLAPLPNSEVQGSEPKPSPSVLVPNAQPPEAASDSVLDTPPRIIRGNDRVLAPSTATAKFSGAPVSFKFEEAPVTDVTRTILGDVLKVDYVLHPPITGTITLATRSPVQPDEAAFLLESALQANGMAMVKDSRGFYHVGRPDALKGIGGGVRQIVNGVVPAGYGAIVVPLQYIGAAEMATILRPLMPPEALIRVDTVRNLLVMVGSRTQAEGWMDMVSTFDVDLLKGMSVGVFPLKHVSTKEVEAALNLLNGGGAAGAASTGGNASQLPAGAAAAVTAAAGVNPFLGALRVMPLERLNSILVVTPRAAYLEEARRWIERLDRPGENSNDAQLFVYPVKNGNARHLAGVLSGIFGDGKSAAANEGVTGNGVAPGLSATTTTSSTGTSTSSNMFSSSASSGLGGRLGTSASSSNTGSGSGQSQQAVVATFGNVRLIADETNNSLLVWAPGAEYKKIEAALKRLDLPVTQVLIEATIVEVSLKDSLEYGVQWFFTDKARSGLNGSGSLLTSASAAAGSMTAGTGGGFAYTLTGVMGASDVRAVVNALASQSAVKVLSSPSLMVQDNFTANIMVGTQQPVNAGTTVSGTGGFVTTNIQYKDVGVSLAVTPSVNEGNTVNLVINQAVSSLGTFDTATQQYAFNQRSITSKVAVRSGEPLVLGGMISENTTNGDAGVPLLKDIPLVGKLFGATSIVKNRTELLLFITPRIVRSDQEARFVGNEMRDRMKELSAAETRKTFTPPPQVSPIPPGMEPLRN